jgi:glyoxylase-like metal-dependent hydrolase (beta-lactamase superfamily II)
VFALACAALNLAAADLPPLVHQIAPGVYYRQSEDEKRIIATTSWIEFKDFVVVIDANFPWGAKAILTDLKATTAKPIRFVLDTHYHADHSYGNGVFAQAGATIISSEMTAEDSRTRNTASWEKDTGVGEQSLKVYSLVHPQLTFKDSMAISDGSRRLELIRVGPGHTRGDSVAWLPAERIVFTGDLCTTRAQNNLGDAGMSPDGWLQILDRLAAMNPAIVVPGHGRDGTVDALKGQRAYLSAIFDGVRNGMAKGTGETDIFNSIDWPKYKPWSDDEKRNHTAVSAVYKKFSSTPATQSK